MYAGACPCRAPKSQNRNLKAESETNGGAGAAEIQQQKIHMQ